MMGHDLRLPEGAGALRWTWVAALVILLDQVTKSIVTYNLGLFQTVEVMPFVKFTLMHNTGAAFSILADAGGWQRWAFITLGITVSLAILLWLWFMPRRGQSLLAAGLVLIMGGAIGNVVDRIIHGHVIDFVLLYYGEWAWPAFNLADSAISVGAVLIIIDAFKSGRHGTPTR